MTAAVLLPVGATFRAVAMTVVPETAALEPKEWEVLERGVEAALSQRPETMRRQLVLFLRVIEYLPLLSHRGRFSRLDLAARLAICRRLERSPRLLIRRGLWGLRTLIFMGYYGQPAVQGRLGYRAHPDGWSARRRGSEEAASDGAVPTDL